MEILYSITNRSNENSNIVNRTVIQRPTWYHDIHFRNANSHVVNFPPTPPKRQLDFIDSPSSSPRPRGRRGIDHLAFVSGHHDLSSYPEFQNHSV